MEAEAYLILLGLLFAVTLMTGLAAKVFVTGPILAIATLTVAVSAILHGQSSFAAPWLCGREDAAADAKPAPARSTPV